MTSMVSLCAVRDINENSRAQRGLEAVRVLRHAPIPQSLAMSGSFWEFHCLPRMERISPASGRGMNEHRLAKHRRFDLIETL